MKCPSGEMRIAFTACACPFKTRSGLLVAKSQTRTVLSAPAETIKLPSGLTATPFTLPTCPERVGHSRAVELLQILSVVSELPATTLFPSGVNSTAFIELDPSTEYR